MANHSPARVVVAEPFAESGLHVLRENGLEVISCVGGTRAQLLERLRDADALIVRSETRVDAELLAYGKSLRVIGRAGVGVDAIDVPAATRSGIVVVNTPAANTIAATEQTFAMMLALSRRLCDARTSLLEGRWERTPFIGWELYGKTLGIVGLGRIGGNVAARAHAFGMTVLAYDPYVSPARAEAHRAELVELDDLLARSDIVSMHVPLTPQTAGMIDGARLARMKPSAFFVNCARGGVVDEPALLAALDAGTIRGAGVDVVAQEPPRPDSAGARLHRHPKVVATPHLGGSTHEALQRIAVELASDVSNVLRGRPAAGAVNAPAPSGTDAELLRPFVDVAYRLGVVLPQLFSERVDGAIALEVHGDISGVDAEPLVVSMLTGLLQATTERFVSVVNARAIAHETGLNVEVLPDETARSPYSASIAVRAGGHVLLGTVVHATPRLVGIDAFGVDALLAGTLIVTRHRDVPGMIGRVGTILGEAQINISTMQVARDERTGQALMILDVDRSVDPGTLAAIARVEGMHSVKTLSL